MMITCWFNKPSKRYLTVFYNEGKFIKACLISKFRVTWRRKQLGFDPLLAVVQMVNMVNFINAAIYLSPGVFLKLLFSESQRILRFEKHTFNLDIQVNDW